MLKDNPKVTAIAKDFKPALVGNLFVCNNDMEGEWISLTTEEIAEIMNNTMFVFDNELGIREVIEVWI